MSMVPHDDILEEYLPVILSLLHPGVRYIQHLRALQHYDYGFNVTLLQSKCWSMLLTLLQ